MVNHSPPLTRKMATGGNDESMSGIFIPPSELLKLAKGIEFKLLNHVNEQSTDLTLLQRELDDYVSAIKNVEHACNAQLLNSDNKITQEIWLKNQNSLFVNNQITVSKYISNLKETVGARKKVYAKSVLSNSSCKTSASSARVKLAENKAKIVAEKAFNEELEVLEKEKLEHQRKMREVELKRKEIENTVLEAELNKLDLDWSMRDEVKVSPDPLIVFQSKLNPDATVFDSRADIPDVKTVPLNQSRYQQYNDQYSNRELLDVMRKQNEISLSMARYQEKAELPKREIKPFDGREISDFIPFIENFKLTVESKCDTDADKLYYLLQFTQGTAHDIVVSCGNSDPFRNYRDAMSLLRSTYGDKYKTECFYLQKLEKWPEIKSEDGIALHRFAIFLRTCENHMNTINGINQLDSPKEIMSVIHKLPYELKRKWRERTFNLHESNLRVTFRELVRFVNRSSELLNQPLFGDIKNTLPKQSCEFPRRKVLATAIEDVEPEEKEVVNYDTSKHSNNCLYCSKSNHKLLNCFSFKRLKYDDIMEFVRNKKLCFGCLDQGHSSKGCLKREQCLKCKRKHPTLIHNDNFEQFKTGNGVTCAVTSSTEKGEAEINSVTCNATKNVENKDSGAGISGKVLLSVIPIKIKVEGRKETILTYASLDTCSTSCFMDQSLLEKLGVTSAGERKINISTMGGKESQINTMIINNLQLYDMDDNLCDTVPVIFAQKIWPFNEADVPHITDLNGHSALEELQYQFIDAHVGIIIGMNRPNILKPLEVVYGSEDGIYASKHKLGWALNGPVTNGKRIIVNKVSVNKIEDIENMVRSMYMEDYKDHNAVHKDLSNADKKWYSIMNNTTKKILGKYEIDLPLKSEVNIFSNKKQIYSIFESLKRKLSGDEMLFTEYNKFMKMMYDQGFMEKIPVEDLNNKALYLMHHSVYHKQKKSIRIVFNCSLKHNGVSLNDLLYQGPDLTNSLLGVLLRFRQEKIAITGDIEKMFLQVHVSPKHRDLLRFVWFRNFDKNEELCEYRLTVHLFGAKSSPSVANYALRQTVVDNSHYSEETKLAVMRNFYVDDLLCSVSDEDTALRRFEDIRSLVATGGFNLTKFVSNSEKLMKIYNSLDSNNSTKNLSSPEISHALGLKWETKFDTLMFNINNDKRNVTRRGLLSVIHGVYDPLGLAGPAMIPAKRLFQESCKLKISWDDELPDSIKIPWIEWYESLPALAELKVPRCYKISNLVDRIELHIFSDGSEYAYGSVAYLRFISITGDFYCSLVYSKARLVPLNNSSYKTIPRIELNGAKLSVILKQTIFDELDYNIDKVYYWTDSTTVLKYLSNDYTRFVRFVSNRICFILSNSQKEDWYYVPTSLNVADYISRGVTVRKLLSLDNWIYGPEFLWKRDCYWPNQEVEYASQELEVKKSDICLTSHKREIDPTSTLLLSCSSWHKLKTTVAWMMRYKQYLNKVVIKGELTLSEIKKSEIYIIKYLQAANFGNTIILLSQNKSLPRENKLKKLDPYLEEDIIKVGGRIQNSKIPERSKHPILLPNKNEIVELIIKEQHKNLGHMGRETLVATLRSKYWIIGINSAVKKLMSNCLTCKRLNCKPISQKMASLPSDRVTGDIPAFENTALDYFGPFDVVNGRKHEKRYGVIFSCLASRAIHLELSYSLSTDSFINSLRRFVSRRGNVKCIRSDNGTNLRGGEKELKVAIQSWNLKTISKWMLQRSIEWKFQPPLSSHFGGVFEREIRSVRKVLTSLLKEQPIKLNDEHLNTLLCEVENILNCRPLTELTDNVYDCDALTPNHLLLLHGGATFPPGVFSSDDVYTIRRWKQIQYLADIFWNRWRKSYLPLLQLRQKWYKNTRNYKIGDLVLLTDVHLPRSQWCLGRIMEIYPDKNNVVRVVKVRIAKYKDSNRVNFGFTELVRPISKLIALSND